METSGDVLSTVDMVMQRRDGPRRLRELDDDDDDVKYGSYTDMSVQFSSVWKIKGSWTPTGRCTFTRRILSNIFHRHTVAVISIKLGYPSLFYGL